MGGDKMAAAVVAALAMEEEPRGFYMWTILDPLGYLSTPFPPTMMPSLRPLIAPISHRILVYSTSIVVLHT
jgi:hypothetical protein